MPTTKAQQQDDNGKLVAEYIKVAKDPIITEFRQLVFNVTKTPTVAAVKALNDHVEQYTKRLDEYTELTRNPVVAAFRNLVLHVSGALSPVREALRAAVPAAFDTWGTCCCTDGDTVSCSGECKSTCENLGCTFYSSGNPC
jgi:hypothetical protein